MTTPVLPEEDPFDVLPLFLPPEAEPVQCGGCGSVYRADELFDGLCETDYADYEESLLEAARAAADEMWLDDQKLRF